MKRVLIILIILQGYLMAVDHILQHGVKVPLIVESDHRLPIVSMQVVFLASGSITDGAQSGLASMSATLLNEGSKKLGAVGFARALENRAIDLNIQSGKESFVFEISALKEQFDFGLDLLIDLISNPNFTDKTMSKIKTQRLSLLERKKSDFDFVASNGLDEIMYKNTPLENPTIGTTETINNLTLKDIQNFLETRVVLSNAVVLFGGDIDSKEAAGYSKKLLASLKVGEKSELPKVVLAKNTTKKEIKKDTEQAYIYFGAPFFMSATDDESYKATVASYILGGGGFGSRIMEEVRVKNGYAYSAYGRFSLGLSSSRFKGYLQTKLENQKQALDLVQKVIVEFVDNGITAEELAGAKEFLLGAEPLRNETMSQRLSRAFNDFYRGKEIGWSKAQLDLIENLSLEEINSFIKKHNEIKDLAVFIVTK